MPIYTLISPIEEINLDKIRRFKIKKSFLKITFNIDLIEYLNNWIIYNNTNNTNIPLKSELTIKNIIINSKIDNNQKFNLNIYDIYPLSLNYNLYDDFFIVNFKFNKLIFTKFL